MMNSESQTSINPVEVTGQDGARGEGPFMLIRLMFEENHIVDASYETYGCPSCMRCGEWVTSWVIGRTPEQVKVIEAFDLLKVLGGLPLGKEHCASLAVNALQDALVRWSTAAAADPALNCSSLDNLDMNTSDVSGVNAREIDANKTNLSLSTEDGAGDGLPTVSNIVFTSVLNPMLPPSSGSGVQGIKVHFGHGLGDSVNFAHQLALYRQRGHRIHVTCEENKRFLFECCADEVTVGRGPEPAVPWIESRSPGEMGAGQFWLYNKTAINLSMPPLPDIGSAAQLWEELCAVKIDLKSRIAANVWGAVGEFMADLPRPLILIHSQGNTSPEWKDMSQSLTRELYKQLLDTTEGSLVLLDWDNRVQRLASWRVRHLTDDWMSADLPHLLALIYSADLLLGVDSGPLHMARFTDTPSVGVFPHRDHYPTRWLLPRGRQVNVVPSGGTRVWNKQTRFTYNIIESSSDQLNAEHLARVCRQMLTGPRYLDEDQLGADVQLQQFVGEWERGHGSPLTDYVDRHTSYDILLREIGARFGNPLIVETGCIRAEEDWGGAGFSTYLLGAYVGRYGGRLISVDLSPEHCAIAKNLTRDLSSVTVVCQDSVGFLNAFAGTIDVLMLDSLDVGHPRCAEHGLEEIQTATKLLHEKSLVIFDDTVYNRRQFTGKGELAVPWMLDNGWQIQYSGHQTILTRRAE